MKIILLFEDGEEISSYQMEFVANLYTQLGRDNLMVYNPPKSGLRDSRYNDMKFQQLHKVQYLIKHD